MRVLQERESIALSNTARSISRHVPVWLLTTACIGGMTSEIVPFPVAVWYPFMVVAFLIAVVGQTPMRRYPKAGLSVGHRAGTLLGCLLINLSIGIPAIYLFHAGTVGAMFAVLVLCGGIISAAVTGRWHADVMFVSVAPYVVYLIALPLADVVAHGPSPSRLVALGVCMLFLGSNLPLILTILRNEKNEGDYRDLLEQARTAAERANDAKSAFVATVSHELRTPISAILAGSEAIEKDPAGPRVQSNAALILDAGKMMRVLLNDLLDLAKLEAGKMTVERIAFPLRELAVDVVRFWGKEAARKGVRLRLENARSLPAWVMGDPTRIRQILNNFLSNALKFTEKGSVTLVFGQGAEGLSFTVRDTGPGLDAEQIARLFQPFIQADSSVARTHGGTGLGLSISLKLATAMNGRIGVEGEPGKGAAFTLYVPLPVAQPPAVVAEPEGEDPPDDAPLCILVVDDHAINRRALALMLEAVGATVALAEGGEQALVLLANEAFDVVLMDVNMPGMDGWETTRRLRAAEGPNRSVPVLAVTGAAEDEALSACHAAGMNGRVIKPIQTAELFAALAALDGASKAPERVADAA
jgi:signal transduction histidine kinase/ActR/RegA family two-component response regulator